MRKRIVAVLACLTAALLLLPTAAFAQSFTITIPERADAIVYVTVDGTKHEEGETVSVEAGTQVSAQAMQLSSTGAMFTGWSVSPGGAVELGNTKIVEFSMPAQDISLEPVIKSFEANASVDANGVLTWDEPFAGYVSRVEVRRQGRTVQSAWISAENGRYTLDLRQLLEERAGDDGIAEGSEHTIDLYYLANEAELSPHGYRGSYLGTATYKYQADKYGLFVGGTEVTSANAADVLGDGTVSYDPNSQTLTLSNAKITKGEHEDAAVYYEGGDLAIVLKGDNVVTGPEIDSGNPVYSRGIYVRNGAVRISGDGSLTVKGGNVSVPYGMAYSYGIWADGDAEILAGTVSATGGTVANSNGTGGSYGVSANQDVIFSGGTVEVTGGEAKTLSYGAYAALGTIAFAGGDVTATSSVVGTGAQATSLALYGFGGVDTDPQDGEMVSVVAGATANDATELDGSPFESDSSITDAVSDSRYVKLESSTIPVVQRYGLSVGGIDVTSENADDVLDNGTVSYDPDTQTLTLKNATISNVNVAGCSIEVDSGVTLPLTIALEGTNSCGPIMTQKGTITISGSGTLTVTQPLSGSGQTGISVQDDLVIDGVKLIVNSNESGVHTNTGNVTIRNNAQVEITTKTDMAYVALLSSGDLTVTGAGTSLKATTERNDPNYELSIHCQGKFLIEQGASVETSGRMISAGELRVQDEGSLLKATGTEASTYAVSGQDSIIISDGATVGQQDGFWAGTG